MAQWPKGAMALKPKYKKIKELFQPLSLYAFMPLCLSWAAKI
jgi:hypothetical protein